MQPALFLFGGGVFQTGGRMLVLSLELSYADGYGYND